MSTIGRLRLFRNRAVRLFCWITGQSSVIRCTTCSAILFNEKSAVFHVRTAHPEILREFDAKS